jgi:hypothetical protein
MKSPFKLGGEIFFPLSQRGIEGDFKIKEDVNNFRMHIIEHQPTIQTGGCMNKRKKLWAIIAAVLVCFLPAFAFAWPVPDTGQTTCYDAAGNVIACPSPGEPFYGQDGNYTINPPSFTKLDSSGNPLSDGAASWAMVRDNVTGLIWEIKQDKDGASNYANPHDADNIYTWYDSDPATNGGYAGTPGNGTDTEDFINALNNDQFGGFSSGWRMPSIKELASIVNYSILYPGPTVFTTYFPNTQASDYWSSTTPADYTDGAWGMGFYDGDDYGYLKYYSTYVRAVRGGQ